MQDNVPLTIGIDHVGFAVKDLAHARRFFCECLGWRVVGENESYSASFVSDGNGIVTLWQVEDPKKCVPFDRRRNIGLHHLALKVVDRSALEASYARVVAWPGTVVAFAPERSGKGPKDGARARRHPNRVCLRFSCRCITEALFLWRRRAVMAISAEAPLVFASLGIIRRGTIRFILTGAMTSFCRLLK
jgi:catechol 2,3-dioxygenase-like lactoylglutathione lyase family enzyme